MKTRFEPGRLTFVVNHVAFFVSHRLPIALEAIRRGCEVELLTGQPGSPVMEAEAVERLSRTPVRHSRFAFGASGLNPFTELKGLCGLVLHLRLHRPQVVHCASPKGILYGGIASRLAGVPSVVLAVSGMGYAFTSDGTRSLRRRMLGALYAFFVRWAYGHPRKVVIVQNADDYQWVLDKGFAEESELLRIPGSGVDITQFRSVDPGAKRQMVLLPARMLVDKGVREFVEAARLLKRTGTTWRFVLAGAADYGNPSAIPESEIRAWVAEGVVEWMGHVHDMTALFLDAAIVCLPSYREGIPKALLEAAAAACAVVTTDTTGCREAVTKGETGDLVPVRDSGALAEALSALMADKPRRERYGFAARRLAEQRFALESVVTRIHDAYGMLGLSQRNG